METESRADEPSAATHAGRNGGVEFAPRPTPAKRKRPATYAERLKWLKKCANAKKTKVGDRSTFRTNLERRRAIQSSKAIANGDHVERRPNPQPDEHAHQQPSITYKCRKCSSTTFENLDALKEHQLRCSSQSAQGDAPDADSAAAAHASGHAARTTRQVVLCSACGTCFENWNIYLHMRDVHRRHICLFCLGLFSQSEKLASHLIVKHNVRETRFGSRDELASKFTETFYLMCCKCEQIFTQRDDFAFHECTRAVKRCSSCDSKGGHRPGCPKSSKRRPSAGRAEPDYSKKSKKNARATNDARPFRFDSSAFDGPLADERFNVQAASMYPFDGTGVAESGRSPYATNAAYPNSSLLYAGGGVPYPGGTLTGSNSALALSNDALSYPPGGLMQYPSNNLGYPGGVLGYNVSDTKTEISPNVLEQLIKEVKGCVSTVNTSDANDNADNSSLKVHDESVSRDDATPLATVKTETSDSVEADDTKVSQTVNDESVDHNKLQVVQKSNKNDNAADESSHKIPKLTVKVPKSVSEKDSSDYSSESEDSDKLTVDLGSGNDVSNLNKEASVNVFDDSATEIKKTEILENDMASVSDDTPTIELILGKPLDKYPLDELLKELLNSAVYVCIYCNHARKIAVNGKQLGLHFITQHKFIATVNSITAEELLPETIIAKIKSCLEDVNDIYINLIGFNKSNAELRYHDKPYECFQCYYGTTMHKDLYFHNRKMHQKTILLCVMCKSNFYTYSELICHLCPGVYILDCEISFRCCICNFDNIPSAFRLMVHLRKRHLACDVCLETCSNQSKLSTHVWKHKLHHLCYRCGIAYRNKPDITKHLFWKHGTESVLCKKCLQKKWPHVYHFCIPPSLFTCDECNLNFTKAVCLKVHKRSHLGDFPHICKEENCTEKFISKKLLAKHVKKHTEPVVEAEKHEIPEKLITGNSKTEEITVSNKSDGPSTSSKSKKAKKSKSKENKDNLLMDVNFPELNLSESGSSDNSDSEVTFVKAKSPDKIETNHVEETQPKVDNVEEVKPEPVVGIWDNFKLYQESLEKQSEKPIVRRHVCESDHDYCIIPSSESPDVEIVGEIKLKPDNIVRQSPKKKKVVKKKNKSGTVSSSSDSSSDSDSTCSDSNCSCCSSSGSSSSSSSSNSSGSVKRKNRENRKNSDASRNSAVDIMAMEEIPQNSTKLELQIAESDLDTEESATDEEFYDKHPQRIANKLLSEKRSQLLQSVASSPVNNGSYVDINNSIIIEESEKSEKKKMKVKKKKKEKRSDASQKSNLEKHEENFNNIPQAEPSSVSNKITISLQSNKVKVVEGYSGDFNKMHNLTASDADSKRASKRRRVPNKFYGYSSDEEYMLKPQLPPKLEWRKEDLPSPSNVISHDILEQPRISDIPTLIANVTQPKSISKDIYSDDSDSSKEGALKIKDPYSPINKENENIVIKAIEPPLPPIITGGIFPRPAGAREAREGESVYCYCRCPYDEVSEMIACDADGCAIEWFHFECVGIMVPPKGKWFCPDCRQKLENTHK